MLAREIDLRRDKKRAARLNALALCIAGIMAVLAFVFSPPRVANPPGAVVQMLSLAVGYVAYIFLHEGVHGVCIRLFCGERASYGFNGMFAYAGKKDAYFTKRQYIVIALAPVAVWGVVLLWLQIALPGWFFPIYAVQVGNIGGAVGDFYVTALLLRMPQDTLCNDDGLSMRFYTRKAA